MDSIFVHFGLDYSERKAQCAWCHHALVGAQMFVYDRVVAIIWYFNVLMHIFLSNVIKEWEFY